MLNPPTLSFIHANAEADVRRLALSAKPQPGVDLRTALEQIAGRQAAKAKLPTWHEAEGIVYPPHISMEQCSSEHTARYKAALAMRLAEGCDGGAAVLADLTGGFGVDFSFMARGFGKAVYVEREGHLCALARHNFSVLGISQAEVVNAPCEAYLGQMGHCTVIFADPARRDSHGARTYAVADCTPDVLAMKDELLAKADYVVLKLSPMLDWHKAASDFGSCVGEVHIVEADGECKELLLVLSSRFSGLQRVYCACKGGTFSYTPTEAEAADGEARSAGYAPTLVDLAQAEEQLYMHEPSPAVMKAGCFSLLSSRFGVRQVAPNSHLFVSTHPCQCFPGRSFTVEAVATMNRRSLKPLLEGVTKANISVRNFPLSAPQLRQRLRLADGGDTYVFATTDSKGEKVLVRMSRTKTIKS